LFMRPMTRTARISARTLPSMKDAVALDSDRDSESLHEWLKR
jgi:hypothetical protein